MPLRSGGAIASQHLSGPVNPMITITRTGCRGEPRSARPEESPVPSDRPTAPHKIDISRRRGYRLASRFRRDLDTSARAVGIAGLDPKSDRSHGKIQIMRRSANSRKAKARAFAGQSFSRGRADGEHLYRQVAQSIGQRIRTGKLKSGERLPSMDDLAEAYGVTKITVRRALLELKSEGLLYTRPAQGTYVAETLPARKQRSRNKVLTVGLISRVLTGEPGPYHGEI